MSNTTNPNSEPTLIREMERGYAAAAEVMERERVERLRKMTLEESRAVYAGLVAYHVRWRSGLADSELEGIKRLEEWRIEEKVAVRRAFRKIAAHAGSL